MQTEDARARQLMAELRREPLHSEILSWERIIETRTLNLKPDTLNLPKGRFELKTYNRNQFPRYQTEDARARQLMAELKAKILQIYLVLIKPLCVCVFVCMCVFVCLFVFVCVCVCVYVSERASERERERERDRTRDRERERARERAVHG